MDFKRDAREETVKTHLRAKFAIFAESPQTPPEGIFANTANIAL